MAERLRSNGIKVWLDEAEINIGDSLTEKIGQAIDKTDYFGVVLSHNSVNSEWVQKELQVAMQKEFSNRKVVVLPLLIETVEIPPFLRDKMYADFTTPQKYEEQFPKLLKALGFPVEEIFVRDKGVGTDEVTITKKQEESPSYITHSEAKLSNFDDIRITGLDDKKSYKPDANMKLYNLYLTMSSNPPTEWQQIFEAERRFPRHSMWRRAWIEGEYIVIHCVPEELEKYHLNDLRQDVKNANIKYRKYLTELAQMELREVKREKEESEQIDDLRRRLKFD